MADELSVLAAWELRPSGFRGARLAIRPSERVRLELLKRKQQQEQAHHSSSMDFSNLLLIVGVTFIIVGGAIVLSTRKPAPVQKQLPPEQNETNWELTTNKKDQ